MFPGETPDPSCSERRLKRWNKAAVLCADAFMQSSDMASPSAGAEEVLGRERWGSRLDAEVRPTSRRLCSPTVGSSRSSALKRRTVAHSGGSTGLFVSASCGAAHTDRKSRRRRTCRPACVELRSLTVDIQDGSDSPSELLRLLGECGRRPRAFLVAGSETLRRRPDFDVSGAANRDKDESEVK